MGVMHLASRAVAALYDSLQRGLPRCAQPRLCRIADAAGRAAARRGPRAVRPFFRRAFSVRLRADPRNARQRTSSSSELGDLIRASAAIPTARLKPGEELDPRRSSTLITRPEGRRSPRRLPRWLLLLRSLFSGIYTVDNMDFVLRDAYMSGYNARAFDLDRLLHYSFFSPGGLTIHSRGVAALVRFMACGPNCFARSIFIARCGRST